MPPIRFWLGLLLLAQGVAMAADNRLTLSGSSTVAPLALEMAKRFEQRNPGVRIDVQAGGSSRGAADARSGMADIGMVSRALTPAEADLKAHLLAVDGIGVIVHKSNPLATLSARQIADVYTGRIGNWKALGGGERPITVVNKAEGRSTLELFLHHFGLNNSSVRAQVVIGDNEQGIKTVAVNRGAIGYVSIGTAEYDAAHGVPVKLLALDGVAASVANVRSGRFKLSRPLNLVTRGAPRGLAARFIAFAQSEQVYDIITAQYFVPITQ